MLNTAYVVKPMSFDRVQVMICIIPQGLFYFCGDAGCHVMPVLTKQNIGMKMLIVKDLYVN